MLNSEAQEELDAYGGHLTVLVEDSNGTVYEVSQIGQAYVNGEHTVTVVMGEKVALD